MKIKQFNLWMKLTLLVFLSILLSLSFVYFQMNKEMSRSIREKQESDLLKIGHSLANDPTVIAALKSETSTSKIKQLAKNNEQAFGLDFVVIMTLDKTRLTHPNSDKIYKKFQGGDEHKAISKGQETVSTASGTLGQSLRAFVPVFNTDGEELGVISIGLTTTRLAENLTKARWNFSITLLLSIMISLLAALFTAFTLKKQMYDLEPKEIAILLEERNAMFENVHDAIIVTNQFSEISLVNASGQKLLAKLAHTIHPYGEKISTLIPDLKTFKNNNTQVTTDELYHQNGVDYLISVAPIVVRKKNVGQIIIIRDMTELSSLHDQLLNTTAYATSLQAQSHDFLNKLHVIYGLTDLQAYDQLHHYLEKILEPEQEFSSRMVYLIKNPLIAGFLIGERSRFVERKLPFMVEIYPDIPATTDQNIIQTWINIVRFIHSTILELESAKDLQIRIGYSQKKLSLTYSLPLTGSKLEQLKIKLQSNYFSNLIVDSKSHITLEPQTQWLIIHINTPYPIYIEED